MVMAAWRMQGGRRRRGKEKGSNAVQGAGEGESRGREDPRTSPGPQRPLLPRRLPPSCDVEAERLAWPPSAR